MKLAACIAVGLVATTSGANLRSKSERSTLRSSIDALARKYDCVSGERNLEDVLHEISQKNQAAYIKLETESKTDLDTYDNELILAQSKVKHMRSSAEPDAEIVRAHEVDKINDAHNELHQKHTTAVEEASKHFTDTQATLKAQGVALSAETVRAASEAKAIASDSEQITQEATKALNTANNDLTEGQTSATTLKTTDTSTANALRAKEDHLCVVTHDARESIVRSDTEIITQLKSLMGDLDALSQRHESMEQSLLEVKIRAKVHANYDQLLQTKDDEINSWNVRCEIELNEYDSALKIVQDGAKKIRDTTKDKHGAIYSTIESKESAILEAVTLLHQTEVASKTKIQGAASEEKESTALDLETKLSAYETMKIEVDTQQTEHDSTKETTNQAIEDNRQIAVEEATQFHKTTVHNAQDLQKESLHSCEQTFLERSTLIQKDQEVIDEIKPLLNTIKACEQAGVGAGATSLLEVDSEATNTKTMVETSVQAKCTLSEQRLAELSNKHTSTLSLLEKSTTHTKVTQATQARSARVIALLASPTTGNLNDWQQRIEAETLDTETRKATCVKKDNDIYQNSVSKAETFLETRLAEANANAQSATETSNADHKKRTEELEERLNSVEVPYHAAQKTAQQAQLDLATANTELSQAQEEQKIKVGAATKIYSLAIDQAENDREEGISKDIAQAKKMDDDATADHTRKSTAKKQACATELEHLTTEKQTLESVVFHLESLERANQGLTRTDSANMATDIRHMEATLAEEQTSSAADYSACLETSRGIHNTSITNINQDFDTENARLVSIHTDAIKNADDVQTTAVNAIEQRKQSNDASLKAVQDQYAADKATSENAASELNLAKKVMESEVSVSSDLLESTKVRAERTKIATIQNKMEEATIVETAANNRHATLYNQKVEERDSNRALLADEKATLDATLAKIERLVSVRDDKTGVESDSTTDPADSTMALTKQSVDPATEQIAKEQAILPVKIQFQQKFSGVTANEFCSSTVQSTLQTEIASELGADANDIHTSCGKQPIQMTLLSTAEKFGSALAHPTVKIKKYSGKGDKSVTKLECSEFGLERGFEMKEYSSSTDASGCIGKDSVEGISWNDQATTIDCGANDSFCLQHKEQEKVVVDYEIVAASENKITFEDKLNHLNHDQIDQMIANVLHLDVGSISFTSTLAVSTEITMSEITSAAASHGGASLEGSQSDCADAPTSCLDCVPFAYCAINFDPNCEKAPAHCVGTCGTFIHCFEGLSK